MKHRGMLILGGASVVALVIGFAAFDRSTKSGRMHNPAPAELTRKRLADVKHRFALKEDYLRKAEARSKSGDIAGAGVEYQKAVDTKIQCSETYRAWGDMMLEYGRVGEAKTAYTLGARKDPHNVYERDYLCLYRLAALYARNSQPEKAVETYDAAVERQYPVAAYSRKRVGVPPDAPRDTRPVMPTFSPDAVEMPRLAAVTHIQVAKDFDMQPVGDHKAIARREYSAAVALDPDGVGRAETWARIGQLSLEMHDGDAAAVAYKKGLQVARKNGDPEFAERCKDGLKRIESIVYYNKMYPEKPYRLAQTPESDAAKSQPR